MAGARVDLFGREAVRVPRGQGAPPAEGVPKAVVQVFGHHGAAAIDQGGHVAVAVDVVVRGAVGVRAGQQAADAARALAGAGEVHAPRVRHQRNVVGVALLNHVHPGIDVMHLVGFGPGAVGPGVILADAPPAQAVIDVAGLPAVGADHGGQFVGTTVTVAQQAVPGQVSVGVITQSGRRRQHRRQGVGHRHPTGVGDDQGGELARTIGQRDPARHGPGEVMINGRTLAVNRQADDVVGQRAGHGQHIVVEKHVGQLVWIIRLEGLLQGVIVPGTFLSGLPLHHLELVRPGVLYNPTSAIDSDLFV